MWANIIRLKLRISELLIFFHTLTEPLIVCWPNNWIYLKYWKSQKYHLQNSLQLFGRAALRRCSVKEVFWNISQNWLENTYPRVSFSIKLQAVLQWKRNSGTAVLLWSLRNFQEQLFSGTSLVAASKNSCSVICTKTSWNNL